MKKISLILYSIFILFISQNVYAKDTVYSINKYKEENIQFIKNGYDKEQKRDGNVVAGLFLKEEKEESTIKDYQIMVLKYDKSNQIEWTFTYGKNTEDKIYDFTYSYNEEGKIDGYLLSMPKTYHASTKDNVEKEENPDTSPFFIKIDLEGKIIKEESLNLEKESIVKKIIPSYQEDKVDGYIILSKKDSKNIQITKYNIQLEKEWSKDYISSNDLLEIDIIPMKKDNIYKGYILLQLEKNETDNNLKIMSLNQEGNLENTLIEESTTKENTKLLESNEEGFLVYGSTPEVKLKKGNDSYFIIKYKNTEEEWELLGTIAIDKTKKISLKEQKEDKYNILYTTLNQTIEVVTIEKEGTSLNKIKKIKNNYYTVEDFYMKKSTIYLIGQINCKEEDSCDYDKNSLYLVSDEDKVIEVKEEDGDNVLIFITFFILGFVIILTIKNHKKEKK